MSNMSHCRFQNTLSDLRDCRDALTAMIDGDSDSADDGALSEREEEAAMNLAFVCLDILRTLGEGCEMDHYLTAVQPKPEVLVQRLNAKARHRAAANVSDE